MQNVSGELKKHKIRIKRVIRQEEWPSDLEGSKPSDLSFVRYEIYE